MSLGPEYDDVVLAGAKALYSHLGGDADYFDIFKASKEQLTEEAAIVIEAALPLLLNQQQAS